MLTVKPNVSEDSFMLTICGHDGWPPACFSFVVFCQSCLLKPLTVFGCGLQQQKNLEAYVGFANLPNQVYRKSVKRGFEFTLMVVGEYLLSCLSHRWPMNLSLFLKWKLICHLRAVITKAFNRVFATYIRPFLYFQSFELFITPKKKLVIILLT